MSKLGVSDSLEGPGVVPAQDHRPDVEIDKLAAHVVCRILDVTDQDFVRKHVYDETLLGDERGLSVWELGDLPGGYGNQGGRTAVMWRHAWGCATQEFGDGDIEDPPSPDPYLEVTPGGGDGPSTPSSAFTLPGYSNGNGALGAWSGNVLGRNPGNQMNGGGGAPVYTAPRIPPGLFP